MATKRTFDFLVDDKQLEKDPVVLVKAPVNFDAQFAGDLLKELGLKHISLAADDDDDRSSSA